VVGEQETLTLTRFPVKKAQEGGEDFRGGRWAVGSCWERAGVCTTCSFSKCPLQQISSQQSVGIRHPADKNVKVKMGSGGRGRHAEPPGDLVRFKP